MSKWKASACVAMLLLFFCVHLSAQGVLINSTPTALDFGNVSIGDPQVLNLDINPIAPPVTISSAYLTGNIVFTINYLPALPATLSGAAPMHMEIGYTPNALGIATGTLFIVTTVGEPLQVALSGTGIPGIAPPMLYMPDAYNYGLVFVGASSTHTFPVQLTTGWVAASGTGIINSAILSGNENFHIISITNATTAAVISLPTTLAAGTILNFEIEFSPGDPGPVTAILELNADDGATYTTSLSGSGVGIDPNIQLNPNSFIMTIAEQTGKSAPFFIKNTGQQDLTFTIDTSTLPAWITLSALSGTVTQLDSLQVNVQVNTIGIVPSFYSYLISIDSNDPDDSSRNLMITIEVTSLPLVADFHADVTIAPIPLTVVFMNDSHSDADASWSVINSYEWDFNNDGIIDSYAQNPTYVYLAPGSYTVRLTVGTNTGLTATKIRQNYITATNQAPTVVNPLPSIAMTEDITWGPTAISYIFSDPNNDNLTFSCPSSTHLTSTLTGNRLTIVPAPNWFGSELITLRATDPHGLFADNPITVTVASVNDAPVLSVPANLYFIRNSIFTVDFGQYINDPDNPDSEISIHITEGQMDPVINYVYTPTNLPDVIGQLSVAFSSLSQVDAMQDFIITVNDNAGRRLAWADFNVHVLHHFSPQINLNATYQYAGQSVNFLDATLGNPDHWLWEFGDGTTSTQQNPVHQYLNANLYDVRLTLGNSQVPTEDRFIFIAGLINLSGTAVTETTNIPDTWTPQGSPYNLFGDLVIPEVSSVEILPNVTVNLFGENPIQIQGSLTASGVRFQPQTGSGRWGGIRFLGGNREPSELQNCELVDALNPIIVEGSSPLINNVTITVSDSTSLPLGTGISISGTSACSISNTEIFHYKTGMVIDTQNIHRETPSLTNVRIRNTTSSLRTIADPTTGLLLKSTANIDSLVISDFNTGLLLDSAAASSPHLNGVHILNSDSQMLFNTTGIRITGNTIPNFTLLEIENAGTGLILEDVHSTLRETGSLTNVRIRNTSSSLRSITQGIVVRNAPNLSWQNVEVDSFSTGMKIEATNRTETSTSLTNVRIRNTTSSLRNSGSGLIINGAINARINDLEINDYQYGMSYQQDAPTRAETNASLTNVRIRNTTGALRQLSTGATFSGLGNFSLTNVEIANYGIGLELNASQAQNVSNPTLSDIRILSNYGEWREQNTGIFLGSGVMGSLKNSHIEEAAIGIFIAENNRTVLENNLILNCITGIKAAGTNPLPIRKQVLLIDDQYLVNNPQQPYLAMDLVGSGPWNVFQNSIYNYPNGLNLSYATVNFHSNIMWRFGQNLVPFTIANSNLTCSYNDIYTPMSPYPGIGNINSNPLWVMPPALDFHLTHNSPCIDVGNPALGLDSDGSRADMGAFPYLHRSSALASPRFITTGSWVNFTNTSLGHDFPETIVRWDFNNDAVIDSYDRNPMWQFTTPGIYSVALSMQSGVLSDQIVYPAFIVVSEFALLAPLNPAIVVNGNNIQFSWNPVTQTIEGQPVQVSFYIVYRSDKPNGFYAFRGYAPAPATSFTDLDAALADKAFYMVLGFAGTREELMLYLQNNQRIKPNSINLGVKKTK